MDLVLFIIGVVVLIKGAIPISKETRISVSGGRILGIVLMIPIAYDVVTGFFGLGYRLPLPYDGFITYGGVIIATIIISRSFKETIVKK